MNKNNLFFLLTSSLILLLLVSCASESHIEEKKVYSESTQREFEAIEVKDTSIKRRLEVASPPIVATPELQPTYPKISAPIRENVEFVPQGKLSAKNQERLQEINQNLAYFCMKHRNDSSFSSEEQCSQFTKAVLFECEKQHQIINTVMVNCIKTRLKKKH
jgi:hypothetical protein